MINPGSVDAETLDRQARDRRLFIGFGVAAFVIAIIAVAASRFTPSFPELSETATANRSLRADYESLQNWSEWLEALTAGLLAGVSVLLAATIWTKPAPGESELSWNRKLKGLTVVTFLLAAFPLFTWAIRLLPVTPMPGLVWWIGVCSGAALVVVLCVLLPWAVLAPGPRE